jgi:serine/threonine-protein kinase
MATVHIGRLLGPAGFGRTVAIKRLHPQFAKDPEFAAMFLDEARLAARVRHTNVVSTIDVVAVAGELLLVMDYVHGESLSRLWRIATANGARPPMPIGAAVVASVLHGLHAAHEATEESGAPLHIIHRDISPKNIQVGIDGIARVLDFGIAKAAWRVNTTRDGALKGTLRYMAPEQLHGEPIDRRADIFSAAIVLWEMLTGRRLFEGEDPHLFVTRHLRDTIASPRSIATDVPPALDAVVMRALARSRDDRFATAREMAVALESAVSLATAREVGDWVRATCGAELEWRTARVAHVEAATRATAAGSNVNTPLDRTVAAAEGRHARSMLPTVPPKSEVTSTEAQTPESASARNRHTGAYGLVLLAASVLVVSGAWARWWTPAATAGVPQPVPSSYRGPPEPALVPDPPPASPTDSGASSRSDVTNPAKGPRALPAARANPPRPASSAAARPAASVKPPVCMKQRSDGIVYFEPCP